MTFFKKLKRLIKIKQYINERKNRKNRYSFNYLNKIHPYKYKIGDILFLPEYILNEEKKIETKIWKIKIIGLAETPKKYQDLLGYCYLCKPLNKLPGEYFNDTVYETYLFKSYSEAFNNLQKKVSFVFQELEYPNWIDYPY